MESIRLGRSVPDGVRPGRGLEEVEEAGFNQAVGLFSLETALNWARGNSLWPLSSGLACCAIEMFTAGSPRYDIARFGSEVFRPSPRQADLLIVSGTVTKKMAPVVKRLYDGFSSQGVAFWLVYPNPADSPAAIREHLKAFSYPVHALRDPRHELVKLAGATVTPEAGSSPPAWVGR